MTKKKDERFIKGEEITLNGVKLRYPYLAADAPDTKFAHQWSSDLLLEEDIAKDLKEMGFNVKDSADGPFIKAKKVCVTRAGKKMSPPRVVGLDPRVPFTDPIGSGTIANVKIWCKYQTVKGTTSLVAYLNDVQVLDCVAGGGTGGFDNLSDEESPF